MRLTVRVQDHPFDPGLEEQQLRQEDPGSGAQVSFLGLMRDFSPSGTVSAMTLEHYPGMTEKSLRELSEQAAHRWPLRGIHLIHRVGALSPLDPIVLVSVTAAHRAEAFAACQWLIDELKTSAPFWKKETTPAGERWV